MLIRKLASYWLLASILFGSITLIFFLKISAYLPPSPSPSLPIISVDGFRNLQTALHNYKKCFIGINNTNINWTCLAEEISLPYAFDVKALEHFEQHAHNLMTSKYVGFNVFDSIVIALPLAPPLLRPSDGKGDNRKAFVKPDFLRANKQSPCIVYAAGIAADASFEVEMVQYGCSVFAFDCTVNELPSAAAAYKNISFNNICIGTQTSFEDSQYATNQTNTDFLFLSLANISKQLGKDCLLYQFYTI